MKEDFTLDSVVDKKYSNEVLDGSFDYCEVSNSAFFKCSFSDAKFVGLDIDDSLFDMCNLSNMALRSYL